MLSKVIINKTCKTFEAFILAVEVDSSAPCGLLDWTRFQVLYSYFQCEAKPRTGRNCEDLKSGRV